MIDLEFEILSMAVLNQDCFPAVIENEHLFTRWTQFYNILLEMHDEGISFSMPSIHSRIEIKSNNENANNIITKLARSQGSTINLYDFISQLKKLRRAEKVHDMGKSIIEAVNKKSMRPDEIESYILETMDSLEFDYIDEGVNISDYANNNLDDIFPSESVHKTGIAELDEKMYGLKDGHLIIIAARPSRGKTALALQIAENFARDNRDEKDILVFSLETPKNGIYARYLSRRSRVPSWKIEYKKMSDDEIKLIHSANNFYQMSKYKIYIYDSIFDINKIKSKIKRTRKLKAVVVDYLQLVGGGQGKSREQEVAYISRQFKLLAQQLNIPIILLSQLNRAIEAKNSEPELSHLRESGAIEQDANVVIFIHSKDDQHNNDIEETAFYLKKNKNGRTGKIPTMFNKPVFEFGLIPKEKEEDWRDK
jgi:replicative DNA helicase